MEINLIFQETTEEVVNQTVDEWLIKNTILKDILDPIPSLKKFLTVRLRRFDKKIQTKTKSNDRRLREYFVLHYLEYILKSRANKHLKQQKELEQWIRMTTWVA